MGESTVKRGDVVTFRPVCAYETRTMTRKVRDVSASGQPIVKAFGYDDFYVHLNEIKRVVPAP